MVKARMRHSESDEAMNSSERFIASSLVFFAFFSVLFLEI